MLPPFHVLMMAQEHSNVLLLISMEQPEIILCLPNCTNTMLMERFLLFCLLLLQLRFPTFHWLLKPVPISLFTKVKLFLSLQLLQAEAVLFHGLKSNGMMVLCMIFIMLCLPEIWLLRQLIHMQLPVVILLRFVQMTDLSRFATLCL